MNKWELFALPFADKPGAPDKTNHESYILGARILDRPDGPLLEASFYSRESLKLVYRQFIDGDSWIAQGPDGGEVRNIKLNGYTGYTYSSPYRVHADADAQRVVNAFFGLSGGDAVDLLWDFAERLRDIRRGKQQARLNAVTHELEGRVPELPKIIEKWVREYALTDGYMMYMRTRDTIHGYCTNCEQFVTLADAKHNEKTVCPACGKTVTIKAENISRTTLVDSENFSICLNDGQGGIWIRCFNVERDYKGPAFLLRDTLPQTAPYRTMYREYARFCLDNNGVHMWRSRNFFCPFNYNRYKGEPVELTPEPKVKVYRGGKFYMRNIPKVFEGTRYAYCGLREYLREQKDGISSELLPIRYLIAFARWPQLEYLRRQGFTKLAKELIDGTDGRRIFKSKKAKKLAAAIGVDGNDLAALRKLNPTVNALEAYRLLRGKGVRAPAEQLAKLGQIGDYEAYDRKILTELRRRARRSFRSCSGTYCVRKGSRSPQNRSATCPRGNTSITYVNAGSSITICRTSERGTRVSCTPPICAPRRSAHRKRMPKRTRASGSGQSRQTEPMRFHTGGSSAARR